MTESTSENTVTDMTDFILNLVMAGDSPINRLKIARRFLGCLDPCHKSYADILNIIASERQNVQLEEIMFPFEQHIVADLPETVTIYGLTSFSLDQEGGDTAMFHELQSPKVIYYLSEQDAEADAAQREWLGTEIAKWRADISKDDILFLLYDRAGYYRVVCLPANVRIHRDTICTTVVSLTWLEFVDEA